MIISAGKPSINLKGRAMMLQRTRRCRIAVAALGAAVALPALAADREQPRIVVNLVGAIKAPFGPKMEGEKTGAGVAHRRRRRGRVPAA